MELNSTTKITYIQVGDYLIPNIALLNLTERSDATVVCAVPI